MLTVAVIVLLSEAVATGLLDGIGWLEVGIALAIILVVRPVSGWFSLTPVTTGPRERGVIAFFGVRGVGSLFCIAYALTHGDFLDGDRLWAIVALAVVGSILIHGIAATALLDDRRERRAARDGAEGSDVPTTAA